MNSFDISKYVKFAVFVFFLYFFTIAHPVYPFDIDDWGCMISTRWAHPIPLHWNPTRVLPGLLPAICSEIAFVVSRISGICLVDTMTFVTAILISCVIMFYYEAMETFLIRKYHTKVSDARVISLIFLTMHFMALSLRYEQNPHFFYSHDLCCYFFYTIPNVLCAIFVLHYLTGRFSFDEMSYKTAIYILLLYLLLFSNLYSTIILASLFFIQIIWNLYVSFVVYKVFQLKRFLRENIFCIVVIMVWLCVHILEIQGGRADTFQNGDFFENVFLALRNVKWELWAFTPVFKLTVLFIIVVFSYHAIKRKINTEQVFLFLSMSFFSLVYSSLLSAKVDVRYMMRSDVLFPAFFFFMIAFVVVLDSAFKSIKYIRCFSLIILMIFMSYCNLPSRSYMDVNDVNPKWGMEFSRRNLKYIRNLENKKQKEILLPRFSGNGNFPLSASYGDRIVELLYKQGEINSHYHVEDIIDSVNAPCYLATEYQMVYYW